MKYSTIRNKVKSIQEMGISKDLICSMDDYNLQDSFAGIMVIFATMYEEMERRGLFINPKKRKDMTHYRVGYTEEQIGDWVFSQYDISSNILIAEVKLPWYDEERLEDIKEELRKKGCRVFVILADSDTKYYKRRKNSTRLEIYKKYDEKNFKEKIADFQELIKNIDFK